MSPLIFAQRMRAIRDQGSDPEVQHGEADRLLVAALRSNGYASGLKTYEALERWYA